MNKQDTIKKAWDDVMYPGFFEKHQSIISENGRINYDDISHTNDYKAGLFYKHKVNNSTFVFWPESINKIPHNNYWEFIPNSGIPKDIDCAVLFPDGKIEIYRANQVKPDDIDYLPVMYKYFDFSGPVYDDKY